MTIERKMKIVLLTDCLADLQAGAEKQIFALAQGLDKNKYDVTIVSLECEGTAPRGLIEAAGCRLETFIVKRIYGISGIKEGLKFKKFLRDEAVDVLLTYHFSSDIWGAFWARLAKVKVVISNRRDMGFWRKRQHVWAYKCINRWTHQIIVNAGQIKQHIINQERLSSDKIQVIYNGVEAIAGKAKTSNQLVKEFDLASDDIKIVHVANLKPIKGHEYLLKAFALVVETHSKAKLLLVGEDKLAGELQKLTKDLGLQKNVLFLGKRKDVSQILGLADICVLPSLSEGMSNAILEYMSAGKPVLATNVGGNGELVFDNENGFLVEPKNSEAIRVALSMLIIDGALRRRFGKKSKEIASRQFSMIAMVEQYQQLFDELLTFKMKVLHLISSGGFFGAEKVLLTLAQNIQSDGFESIVGAMRDKRHPHLEIVNEAEKLNIPTWICFSAGRFDVFTILRIRKYIKENHISLLHTHNYKSDILGCLAAKWAGIPVVATAHGFTDVNHSVSIYEKLDRFFLKCFFQKVIVVTAKMLPGFIERKKKVISNGIDILKIKKRDSYRSQIRHDYQIKSSDFVIGTVGRLSKEKNQIALLQACYSVLHDNRHIKLLIVGDGPERARLQQFVKARHIEDQVIFTGLISDVEGMYQAMDVFVLPSLTEGVPLTILEAMASKLAVIASAVGGVPEIIEDNVTGFLFESEYVHILKEKIVVLMKDKALAKKIAKNAFAFVEDKFSLETMVSQYKEVYREQLD